MTDFQSQLESLVNEAALQNAIKENDRRGYIKGHDGAVKEAFKQGCDLLIPVLMRAIEQRNQNAYGYPEYENEQLLNILKGETNG